MIEIDIPEPKYCAECPCSYYIQTGGNEGKLMCNALEFRDACDYLVEEMSRKRPDKCPIVEREMTL